VVRRTEADSCDVCTIFGDVQRLANIDHEVDDELPVVDAADVRVPNAARVVDDETYVQYTICRRHDS